MRINPVYRKEMLTSIGAYLLALGVVALFNWIIFGDGLSETGALWTAVFCLLSNQCIERAQKESK